MVELARRVADSRAFQHAVLAVILFTAALVGLETSDAVTARYGPALHALETLVQVVFVVEIAVRLLAHWPHPGRFFLNGWNVFDFAVVAASLLPQAGAFATVARLARLLRVTRLISAFPELRLIVTTMLRSIPSMGHVLMMLSLLLYVYGILGIGLFREEDPDRWGGLGSALLTLFQMLTLEGWVEVQADVIDTYPWAWVYFASFIFAGVFVVVNLFIAVVINNLEAAKVEHLAEADRLSEQRGALEVIRELRARLDRLEQLIRTKP